MLLRCDFGSEYARQGRGDNILTRALSEFRDASPGIRVRPVAPRAQSSNRVELVIQKIMGHAFMNANRARLGGAVELPAPWWGFPAPPSCGSPGG